MEQGESVEGKGMPTIRRRHSRRLIIGLLMLLPLIPAGRNGHGDGGAPGDFAVDGYPCAETLAGVLDDGQEVSNLAQFTRKLPANYPQTTANNLQTTCKQPDSTRKLPLHMHLRTTKTPPNPLKKPLPEPLFTRFQPAFQPLLSRF